MEEQLINHLFIPYEQALELKNLGFKEHCVGFFNPFHYLKVVGSVIKNPMSGVEVTAPTYQQAFKFFRDKRVLYCINPSSVFGKYHVGYLGKYGWELIKDGENQTVFYTYEEAELSCLNKLIELLKEIQK